MGSFWDSGVLMTYLSDQMGVSQKKVPFRGVLIIRFSKIRAYIRVP